MPPTMIHDYPSPRSGTPAPPVRPFYWVCQAAGWAVFCGYVTLGYLYGNGGVWKARDLVNIVLFTMVVCPAVSHFLRSRLWRWGWVDMPPGRLLPRAAALVVLSAVTLTLMTAASLRVLDGPPWLPTEGLLWMTAGYGWAFVGWFVIYNSIQGRRRHHEARAAARDAQLQALAAQLNPHFLFNCLNSVRALIVENPARAASMVTGLADLLRYALSSDRQRTVNLAQELEIVDEYLNLERVRFEERLRVERAIDPAALSARLPPMLVQTLVENAVKHGVAVSAAGGVVRVRAEVNGQRVDIAITNTGGFRPAPDGQGRGLRNATERLRLLYGQEASLRVEGSSESTTVSLSLPLETVA